MESDSGVKDGEIVIATSYDDQIDPAQEGSSEPGEGNIRLCYVTVYSSNHWQQPDVHLGICQMSRNTCNHYAEADSLFSPFCFVSWR